MKKIITQISILFVLAFVAATGNAQNVDVSTGGPATSYPDLKSAFDAINAGTHTGVITIGIKLSTTETAPAVLNASGNGSALYSSIVISPTGGAARTISGYLVGGHLIDLNGADYVTIDGLNSGGNSLTISNTALGASTAIRFTADATNNTVTNCSLEASTDASFGVVYFGTGITTGNDNNTISSCNIGPAGANLPLNGIYSMGSSASIDNSGNIVSGNKIFDYYNAGASTNGMNINSGNSGWTITNNRFYQTSTRVYSSAGIHYGINITSGSGYSITDNVIGFANSAGTGTTNLIGLSAGSLGGTFPSAYTVGGTAVQVRYAAMYLGFTTGGAVSSIQGNTIAGFAIYTSNSASSTYGIFCGIGVASGNVNIGTVTGNTIGTPTSSIYTASTASAGIIAGIYVTTVNSATIENNTIQNLDAMGTTATTSGGINGINTEGAGGTFIVAGNTIGNTTEPNLRMGNLTTGAFLSNVGTTFGIGAGTAIFQGIRNAATGSITIGLPGMPNIVRNAFVNSTTTLALFRGIYSTGGTPNVSYNIVSNISAPTSSNSYTTAALAGLGILVVAANTPVISNNTVSRLNLLNPGTGGYTLAGIAVNTPATSLVVSKNKIYALTNASTAVLTTAPGTATGIFIRDANGANCSIDNNMISLGDAQPTNTAFIGIWAQYAAALPTTLKIYYNTVNIEGNVASGAQPSMCLQRGEFSATAATVYTIDAKNNIFTNTRSGGTGKHYAITNNYGVVTSSSTGWGAGASDYNVLNGNAATIGYWSGDKTFADWKTASACDNNSFSGIAVIFNNTPAADLHMNIGLTPTRIESGGMVLAGYTTDYDGDTRPGPAGSVNGGATAPDIGADEFDGVPFGLFTVSGIVTHISCFGGNTGAITTSVSGGTAPFGYVWSNLATSPSLTGLTMGTYTVTVTDAAFSTVVGSWTVTQPSELSLAALITNASCPATLDGVVNLSVNGGTPGFGYLWSNAAVTEDLAGVAPGSYTVTVTDANGCLKTGSWIVGVADPVCNNLAITGTITTDTCFNAHFTVTVAGTSPFTVKAPKGNTEIIAGQSILFGTGTKVENGAYLLGHISGTPCLKKVPSVVATSGREEETPGIEKLLFTLYPNPTSGNFSIVQKGNKACVDVKIEVYNISGRKVMNETMVGEKQHDFRFSDMGAGLYFVKVIAGGNVETVKLIKL